MRSDGTCTIDTHVRFTEQQLSFVSISFFLSYQHRKLRESKKAKEVNVHLLITKELHYQEEW